MSTLYKTLSLLALGCAGSPDEAHLGQEDAHVLPREVIIDVSGEDAADVLADHDMEVIRELRSGKLLVRTPTEAPIETVLDRLNEDPRIVSSQPHFVYHLNSLPNDPGVFLQPHLTDIGAFDDIGGLTGAGVTVAVLDSGVHADGPDGIENLLPGYDFIDDDDDPSDFYDMHGTVIAGLIAQRTNNAVGYAGAAPGVTILPVRVVDGRIGKTGGAFLAAGMEYAIDQGADILSMSLSTYEEWNPVDDADVLAALQRAEDEGVLVVASVSNEGRAESVYPAAYPSVMAVGATDLDGNLTVYSNFPSQMEIMAPGGNDGDLNDDGYEDYIFQEYFSWGYWWHGVSTSGHGTSWSVPQVVAAAALVMEAGLTDPDDIRLALTTGAGTATDASGYSGESSKNWPLLDIPMAIERAEQILRGPDPIPGDLNGDGVADSDDIDHFSYISSHFSGPIDAETMARLDLDGDNDLDEDDRMIWIEEIMGTRLGDVDLDQDVDTRDITTVIMNFWPDTEACSEMSSPQLCRVWADGDLDGDGDIDTRDITYAIINFHFGY